MTLLRNGVFYWTRRANLSEMGNQPIRTISRGVFLRGTPNLPRASPIDHLTDLASEWTDTRRSLQYTALILANFSQNDPPIFHQCEHSLKQK
jgi:hypothetical protein